MRRAFGFDTYGMRHDADRLLAEYASITGASKPGTRRLYEFVVELANALIARACLKMPPMYHSAVCDRPPYPSPVNRLVPPLASDWCTCMPLPLSPTMGLGMNVAVLPLRCATFLMMYFIVSRSSAFLVNVLNLVPISHWPALATSWWCTSTSMPTASSVLHISARMSCSESSGATGK